MVINMTGPQVIKYNSTNTLDRDFSIIMPGATGSAHLSESSHPWEGKVKEEYLHRKKKKKNIHVYD